MKVLENAKVIMVSLDVKRSGTAVQLTTVKREGDQLPAFSLLFMPGTGTIT